MLNPLTHHRLPLLLAAVALLCTAACTEERDEAKGPEQDALEFYEAAKADTHRKPTEHGPLIWGEPQQATLTDGEGFHTWTFTLSDVANFELTATGPDDLDTVMYLYRRRSSQERWGRYIRRNDDHDGTRGSQLADDEAEAAEYRVLIKGHDRGTRGTFTLTARCVGTGCLDDGAHVAPGDTGLPERLSTGEGGIFEGRLGPEQRVVLALEAQEGDRISVWLRRRSTDELWDPYLGLATPSEGPDCVGLDSDCPYGDPRELADAHLPYRTGDLDWGWELFESGEHQLTVANLAPVAGDFQLELRCTGGPCAGDVPAPIADGYPFADQRDDELRASLQTQILAQHIGLSYIGARRKMFAVVDHHDGVVTCVYTGEPFETEDIPRDTMNAEHTWPRSLGAEEGFAKSDLHHLFPTLNIPNGIRANLPFCEVEAAVDWEQAGSMRGQDASGTTCFEPRDVHKGNVARAIFYFAVTYAHPVDAAQEATLRAWHTQDPVDDAERARNDRVADAQGSRNPFVDHPDLVDRLADL